MLRNNQLHLRTLKHLTIDKETICSGNNAVVVQCRIGETQSVMSLKCYYRTHHNLTTIYGTNFYPKEIGIYTLGGTIEYLDAVITQWIFGTPLDKVLRSLDVDHKALSRAFDTMAMQTLQKSSAHGDIKPDNIIVGDDGSMHLVDWDATWQQNISHIEEWGTIGFRHPKRRNTDFNRHIDDYPIALISTTLAALAIDPQHFSPYLNADGSMFDLESLMRGKDELLEHALSLFAEIGDATHYHIAKSLYSQHPMIPRLSDYLKYRDSLLPKSIPDSSSVECVDGLWGCYHNDSWVVAPLFNRLDMASENSCNIELDEHRYTVKLRGKLIFEADIPAELEHRMRRLQALRDKERSMLLPGRIQHSHTSTTHNVAARRWSNSDDERLVMMYCDNLSIRCIAYMLNRSETAIRRRISALRLPLRRD